MKKLLVFMAVAALTVFGPGMSKVNAKSVTTTSSTTTIVPVYTGTQSDPQNGYYTTTYGLWAGQHIAAGTVLVANDDSNIYVTITSPALISEVHIYLYDSSSALPTSRPIPGKAPFKVSGVNANSVTVTIPVSSIADGVTFNLAVHVALVAPEGNTDPVVASLAGQTAYAAGNTTPSFSGKGAWYYIIGYTVAKVVEEPKELSSETAWAYGGNYAVPFGSTRWGWTNGPLTNGTYVFDLYAGAGQNDLSKGTLVGNVTISYVNNTMVVTYNLTAGFTLGAAHLYVGTDILPTLRNGNYTYAPGQFPNIAENINGSSYTFIVTNVTGPVYVAAHADVLGYFN